MPSDPAYDPQAEIEKLYNQELKEAEQAEQAAQLRLRLIEEFNRKLLAEAKALIEYSLMETGKIVDPFQAYFKLVEVPERKAFLGIKLPEDSVTYRGSWLSLLLEERDCGSSDDVKYNWKEYIHTGIARLNEGRFGSFRLTSKNHPMPEELTCYRAAYMQEGNFRLFSSLGGAVEHYVLQRFAFWLPDNLDTVPQENFEVLRVNLRQRFEKSVLHALEYTRTGNTTIT